MPRTEPIKSSPIAWSDISQIALPRILDNTLLTVAGVGTTIQNWESTYPSYVNVDVMGQSVQSIDLNIVRLFDDGIKPIIGISCGIHGNEIQSLRGWISAIDWILSSSHGFASSIRDSLSIYFVPLLNPDGTNVGVGTSGRNNANNVNLNRNWPYFFNSTLDPDKGSSPLSEPESSSFVGFMTTGGKIDRVIGWIDVHAWISQTTFGFLTEKMFYSHDNERFQRSAFNHINSIIKEQNYTTAVNPPVILTEYLSTRKSYLSTWVANNGSPQCWGGIIEFPETESNSLNASVGQDCMMGLCAAGLQYIKSPVNGVIVESSEITSSLNTNSTFENWSLSESRPQFFSGTKVGLSSVFDSGIGRTVLQMERPAIISLSTPQGEGAYTTLNDAAGKPELFIIGGEDEGNNRIQNITYINYDSGTINSSTTFPIFARYMAATNDGTDIYVSGGFTTGYVDAMYKSTGSGISVGFSTFMSSLSVYNSGVQRHSMTYWSTNDYLIISGGRDSSAYKTGIYAVDKATGYIWKIANFLTARGWHTSTIYNDTFYAFGGWTGSTVLSSVEKITLTDNKVGFGTTASISSTNNFSTSEYTFTSSDIGRIITIQGSSNKGEYTISTFINSSTVTITPNPPTNNTTNQIFVVSDAAPSCATTTSLPSVRHRQMIAQDDDTVYLFGGMYTSSASSAAKELYKYSLSSGTVSTISYDIAEYYDDEEGIFVPLESPYLASAAGYYDSEANSIVIVGGNDETGTARLDIYQIDLTENLCDKWSVDLTSYGYLRMNQVFTTQKGMLVAAVKNMTARNNTKAPYLRLTVLAGPISNSRKVRSWYQVPPINDYEILMMPFELEAGESEFRCYLRHYTAGTTVRVASFQLLDDIEKMSYPLPVTGGKQPDSYTQNVSSGILSFSPSVRFILEGEMIPLVSVNTNISEIPLISFYGPGNEPLITLSFSAVLDPSPNATGTGTFKVTDEVNSTSQTQTSFEINRTRSFGKVFRYDILSWRLDKNAPTSTLKLSFYGDVLEFPLPNIPYNKKIDYVSMTNGIFSELKSIDI